MRKNYSDAGEEGLRPGYDAVAARRTRVSARYARLTPLTPFASPFGCRYDTACLRPETLRGRVSSDSAWRYPRASAPKPSKVHSRVFGFRATLARMTTNIRSQKPDTPGSL